ncbi:MAG: protein kinase domain-containing protein, partial [Nannocystaceae bacterium]
MTEKNRNCVTAPRVLGQGKFAKVFEALQQCQDETLTHVAIKSLHARADETAEQLFEREVALMAELTKDDTDHYVSTLDILQVGPLFMSACGKLFQPMCPHGCGTKLARSNRPSTSNFPRLGCPSPSCGKYEVSAEFIDMAQNELFQHPANPHCTPGDTMATGTIINFVDRRVIVMEKLGSSLDECFDNFRSPASSISTAPTPTEWKGAPEDYQRLRQKVHLLHKMDLMIQLAEAVYRLHDKHDLIHRDLAPDNVMIQMQGHEISDENLFVLGDQDLFDTRCPWRLKLIDFGLSEDGETNEVMPWYAIGDVNTQGNKWPYMSPEAKTRETDLRNIVARNLTSDGFVLPEELSVGDHAPKRGDLIADKSQHDPECEFKIVEITANESGQPVAVLDRTPSPNISGRALQLIRRLGRAHDVYSTGAMLYYVLTGAHSKTNVLASFVVGQQNNPLDFLASELNRHPDYPGIRDAIPAEEYWSDQLMIVILRAMVRGQKGSFVPSRTDVSSDGIRQLRDELTRLYHLIQREVVAIPVDREWQRRYAQERAKL